MTAPDKTMLVDAIIGAGFRSMGEAAYYQHRGWAYFTGNQWNEDWKWDRTALMALDQKTLETLYADLKSPLPAGF